MAKKSGVFIGIPNKGPSAAEFWIHLRRVIPYFPVGINWTFGDARKWLRKPIPEARTIIAQEAKRRNMEWLCMLDDDVLPPLSFLQALLNHGDPIVTGVYWTKTSPTEPIIFKTKGGGSYKDWVIGDYFDVWAAGLGCCLVNMEVFDEMPEPWFLWNYERQDGDTTTFIPQGEDYYFLDKAAKYGFPVMCDTRIQCDHIEPMSGSIYPGQEVIGEVYGITKDMIKQWKDDPSTVPGIPPIIQKQAREYRERVSIRRQELFNAVPGKKLSIGLRTVEEGFLSVGTSHEDDIQCDLDVVRLPLKARSVGAITMRFSFEYFAKPIQVMEELWRVCKKNAVIEIISTYGNTSKAISNPYAHSLVTESSFIYYSKEARESLGMPWSPDCDFDIIKIEQVPENDFLGKGERDTKFAARCYTNSIQHIRVVLKAVK